MRDAKLDQHHGRCWCCLRAMLTSLFVKCGTSSVVLFMPIWDVSSKRTYRTASPENWVDRAEWWQSCDLRRLLGDQTMDGLEMRICGKDEKLNDNWTHKLSDKLIRFDESRRSPIIHTQFACNENTPFTINASHKMNRLSHHHHQNRETRKDAVFFRGITM